MLHTLNDNKIQRVRDLITEHTEDEDRCGSANPALHDIVQKLQFIVNAQTEITRKDVTTYLNSEPWKNGNASPCSSSSPRIDVSHSNNNPHPKAIEALGNHVVLTEIFKYGSFRDLNNFRLVNTHWKGIANSAIIQQRLWKLSLKDFSAYNGHRNEPILKLIACIEASGGSFPLTTLDFSFIDENDNLLDCVALRQFYVLMGTSIKHVIFHNFGPINTNEFQDLLVKNLPNVDHIDAGKIFFTNKKKFSLRLPLPCLKTIRFIDDAPRANFQVLPYYQVLLLASINLKEIQNFRVQLTDNVFVSEKMDCIRTFNFALELQNCSSLCSKFSQTNPKLTSLNITRSRSEEDDDHDISPELAQSLKNILLSSKDTLTHLQVQCQFFPVDFQLLKFPNLKLLTVVDDLAYREIVQPSLTPRVFPTGCDCSETFPNVHTVSLLNTFLSHSETLDRYYFLSQAFPSVKTLVIENHLQLGDSLKRNFPNVSHIKIINIGFKNTTVIIGKNVINNGFHSDLNNQIESLEFHQCVLAGPNNCWELDFELDSVFTGVSTDVCRKLLEKHNNFKARGEDEKFAKEILEVIQPHNYLFRNSNGLRRLKILFNHPENVSFRISNNSFSDWESSDSELSSDDGIFEPPTPVISLLSFVYGFSLMPDLEEVIIGYDHYLPNASSIAHVLKPFAEFPYVRIVHEATVSVNACHFM